MALQQLVLDDSAETKPLSQREIEVAQLVAYGLTNKEITAQLFIAERTVKNDLTNTFHKFVISGRRGQCRSQLAIHAIQQYGHFAPPLSRPAKRFDDEMTPLAETFLEDIVRWYERGKTVRLTTAQKEVTERVIACFSVKEAVSVLGLSIQTVKYHLSNTYVKLGVNNITGLIVYNFLKGYVPAQTIRHALQPSQ